MDISKLSTEPIPVWTFVILFSIEIFVCLVFDFYYLFVLKIANFI